MSEITEVQPVPQLMAEGLIILAQHPDMGMIVEMRLPLLPEGQEPDLHNPVHHMIAFLAQNWEMFDKMFKVNFTKFKESLAEAEVKQVFAPSELKLVASDGKSLLQREEI